MSPDPGQFRNGSYEQSLAMGYFGALESVRRGFRDVFVAFLDFTSSKPLLFVGTLGTDQELGRRRDHYCITLACPN
jgi:hypothetical protein